MDILFSFFEFVFRHSQAVVGVSIAFILATGILILWRMVGEGSEGGGASTLDVQALEETLKRVLKQGPLVVADGGSSAGASTMSGGTITDEEDSKSSGAAGGAAAAGAQKMEALIAEREKKITELQTALEQAKTQASSAPADSSVAMLELQNKIRELEARLAEYSIIEDDIADLSLYKDENQRLKSEIDELKGKMGIASSGGGAEAASTPPATDASVAAEAAAPSVDSGDTAEDDVMKQFAAAVSEQAAPKAEAATAIPEPLANLSAAFDLKGPGSAEASEAEPEAPKTKEDVDADFALDMLASVEGTKASAAEAAPAEAASAATPSAAATPDAVAEARAPAPVEEAGSETETESNDDPLAGTLDTNKMLEEVASLDTSVTEDEALDGALDTDKLLMEVSELQPSEESASTPPASSASVAAAVAMETTPSMPEPSGGASGPDLAPGEDLFGEFKDEEKKG